MTKFTAIVAYDANRGMAKNGSIPWDLPMDVVILRAILDMVPLVAGGKTARSMNPKDYNQPIIVLSRSKGDDLDGVSYASSPDEAKDLCSQYSDVIVYGGAATYEVLLPMTDTIFATEIDGNFDCDRFFPEIDSSEWGSNIFYTQTIDEFHQYSFNIVRYDRK